MKYYGKSQTGTEILCLKILSIGKFFYAKVYAIIKLKFAYYLFVLLVYGKCIRQ